jgi:deoxyribodipyrimidine photo-lyase
MEFRIIHWFRQDLRIHDNPALSEACKNAQILPVYINDYGSISEPGSVSKSWLHRSLENLNESLKGNLQVFQGDTKSILLKLIDKYDINKLVWNKVYSPENLNLDSEVIQLLTNKHIDYNCFNGSLLVDPSEILNQQQLPYKVFTPFSKKINTLMSNIRPLTDITHISWIEDNEKECKLLDLGLLAKPDRTNQLLKNWSIGEKAAAKQCDIFVNKGLNNYKLGRDFPGLNNVSKLSPYLHFGEISPIQIWNAVSELREKLEDDSDKFLSELSWREFSYYLLYHFPSLPYKNVQEKFDNFPWEENTIHLIQWQKGITGYPLVDAGMRELFSTGYMHNRLRMIVGSFLVKNLLINWHYGRDWFWERLVDADIANNSTGWQWITGCGVDAAPYFRIFNPIIQGRKFDPDGQYIKTYVPELKNLPTKYLFSPWEAPESILDKSGVRLGIDYPWPIVDLKESREKALKAFASIKLDT